jgi:purine-binding chemotaxis protein CheW
MAVRGMLNASFPLEAPPEEPGEQYLIFFLAGYELAIKAEHIQAVERLPEVTPVPHVAQWISGVMSLRGQIISIVDLRSFLGLDRLAPTPRTRLLAGYIGDMVIGLVVDGVSEMRGILSYMIQPQSALRAAPEWAAPYVSNIAAYGSQHVLLLDIERLLTSEKMQHYQS